MNVSKITMISVAALLAGAPAYADGPEARAAVELTVRSGPSVFDEAVGVLAKGDTVTINGCVAEIVWCEVTYAGGTGFAAGEYLLIPEGEDRMVSLLSDPNSVSIATIEVPDEAGTKTNENGAAAAGATLGSLIAFAAGGPVGGIVAGGILGTAAGSAASEPAEKSLTFVLENPVETVYLNGEVVVGAGLPDTVTTYEIPDGDFRYLNVNGFPVLVDPETNVIVDVIRP